MCLLGARCDTAEGELGTGHGGIAAAVKPRPAKSRRLTGKAGAHSFVPQAGTGVSPPKMCLLQSRCFL